MRTFSMFTLLLCGCARFQDRVLAAIPGDARVVVPADFSADGRRAAWVMQRGETSRAVCGGWEGKLYGAVC
jgi:hypothetical protein